MKIQFSWIVSTTLDRPILSAGDVVLSGKGQNYITAQENPGLLAKIGISSSRAIRPYRLELAQQAWQSCESRLKREFPLKKIAVTRASFELDNVRYVIGARIYSPCTLMFRIDSSPRNVGEEEAFELRDFRSLTNAPIRIIVEHIAAMINQDSLNPNKSEIKIKFKPAMMHTADTLPGKDFVDFTESNKPLLVGLLINNKNYAYADDEIANRIVKSNQEINIKNSSAFIHMLNKQGIITVCSEGKPVDGAEESHIRKVDLYELVWGAAQVIYNVKDMYDRYGIAAIWNYWRALYLSDAESKILMNSVGGQHALTLIKKATSFKEVIDRVPLSIHKLSLNYSEAFGGVIDKHGPDVHFSIIEPYGRGWRELYYSLPKNSKIIVAVVGAIGSAIAAIIGLFGK